MRLWQGATDRWIVGELDPEFVFVPLRRHSDERYWVETREGRRLFVAPNDPETRTAVTTGARRATREHFVLDVGSEPTSPRSGPSSGRAFDAADRQAGLSRSQEAEASRLSKTSRISFRRSPWRPWRWFHCSPAFSRAARSCGSTPSPAPRPKSQGPPRRPRLHRVARRVQDLGEAFNGMAEESRHVSRWRAEMRSTSRAPVSEIRTAPRSHRGRRARAAPRPRRALFLSWRTGHLHIVPAVDLARGRRAPSRTAPASRARPRGRRRRTAALTRVESRES